MWSVTSYVNLYRDGHACERWNRLHPTQPPRVPYVTQATKDAPGVFVAASDYLKVLPDSIDRWLPRPLQALGTDGFGRSDSRAALRNFFEVDARFMVIATLYALLQDKQIDATGGRAGDQGPEDQYRETESGDRDLNGRFILPNLGDGVAQGDVLKVLVKPGDAVAVDQPVLELETDKATIEVPSNIAGKVKEIKVKAGDKVKPGQAVLVLENGASGASGAARVRRGAARC